jgi:hypothetical protein
MPSKTSQTIIDRDKLKIDQWYYRIQTTGSSWHHYGNCEICNGLPSEVFQIKIWLTYPNPFSKKTGLSHSKDYFGHWRCLLVSHSKDYFGHWRCLLGQAKANHEGIEPIPLKTIKQEKTQPPWET